MFIHAVHFWLKPELTDTRRDAFVVGCQRLGDSPNVQTCRVGLPAGTPRDVVDNSYDVQLICGFASRADHDAYQSGDDAVHAGFIAEFQDCWTRVLIYDSVEAE